ncbi:hypothetical protein SAMN04489740_3306 [Arthrobacter alpinus]|uniref:Uncharacterized protein n=1 Tax=Arthrobacter alpinus TaxID=656366 RepID=A0A1H5N1F2_9MICC|nr:hypothetical protein SAMN04489740_3306 [Arthrobacter alpinus]
MKSPFVTAGVTAVIAVGLILSPGLSPASASTGDETVSTTTATSQVMNSGSVASTYGVWYLPCSFAGLRWC